VLNFSYLAVGGEYDRPYLARLWGYKSYNAFAKGVFTPKNTNQVVLFITKDKQGHLTQYVDHIERDILFWEGEKEHGSDRRIVSQRDTIYVFYRERHHSNFIYQGRAILTGSQLNTDRPSKFTFRLVDQLVTQHSLVEEVRQSYQLSETEKQAIIKSRRGQGVYRANALNLWKACSVTGFTKENILIASHIKPWKFSANQERIDHFNSLLLVPSLDKLFDKGYISFDLDGKITISDKIQESDLDKIGVSFRMRLRDVPQETKAYLIYHQEYRFNILKM
jgi:putative restriction endonuclease